MQRPGLATLLALSHAGLFMIAKSRFLATTSLGASLVLAALAAPAWAQTSPPAPPPQGQKPPPPPTQTAQASSVSELVVTGSHIKTNNLTSPDPMTVITTQQAQLTGTVDIAQVLQLSAVAANAQQINNYFTDFITTGGPGVNTISLFGLGSQRTLVLINGERLGPAGVSGQVGPFDLNVLPESMIDHIDIQKDGASSIYGSDAIAGVVNFITKTNQDGGNLQIFANPSQHGGGNSYDVNGSWGKTFDKGYFSIGFDGYRQDPLRVGQRGYLNCSRDRVTDPVSGANLDITDPTTGQDKCFNVLTNTVVDEGQYNGFVEYAVGNGPQVPGLAVVPGFFPTALQFYGTPATLCFGGPTTNTAATRANAGLEPENAPLFNRGDAISGVSRYSVFMFGGYDLTPKTHLYGSFIFNQRDSSQVQIGQFFGLANPFSVQNPGFAFPVPVVLEELPSSQSVDYTRLVGGVKGDLPSWGSLRNWTYDLYAQYSLSYGRYHQAYIPTDRANAVFGAANAAGCDTTAVAPFSAPGPGNEPMSVAEPGASCVPFNLYQDVLNGGFTAKQAAFLFRNENAHTRYDTAYVEGIATGDLYNLPAGPLGAAIGFHVRRESLDDVPGTDFINSNVYNFSTSGETKGSEEVGEVFGELRIPIVNGLPFVRSLDVDISGRVSDYSTYGSNETYKGTLGWALNDWIKVRATYGTAFRAPALYEENLADQTGFFNQIQVDPCIEYGTSGVSQQIQKNCASLGIPPNYDGAGSGVTVFSGGGGKSLKPETAITDTVGFVLTPSYWGQRVDLTIDYYNTDIQNQITQFGASNIIFACFNSTNFTASNPFCAEIMRNGAAPSGAFNPFNIEQVLDPFVNISQELKQGLDVSLNWRNDLPWDVKMSTRSELNWTLFHKIALDGFVVNEFLGAVGEPRFVGNINFEFDRGPWTVNWLVYLVGHSSDNPFSNPLLLNFRGTNQNVLADYTTHFYANNNISVRRRFDKFTLTFGIKNLFDQAPPATSVGDANSPGRAGVTPLAISQYDLIGRSFYALIEARF